MNWHEFARCYIKHEYHCDTCKYCWGGGFNGDDYDDCGCYIYGDLNDDCKLWPPVMYVLGHAKMRAAEYDDAHQYDGIEAWVRQEKKRDRTMERLVREQILRTHLEGSADDLCEADVHIPYGSLYEAMRQLAMDYENEAHPITRETLRHRWARLIRETARTFKERIRRSLYIANPRQ